MSAVTKIVGKHGVRYRAQLRGKGLASKAQTFTTPKAARDWLRDELKKAETPSERAAKQLHVDALIEQYETARASSSHPIAPQSNEHYLLKKLRAGFKGVELGELNNKRIIAYAQARRRGEWPGEAEQVSGRKRGQYARTPKPVAAYTVNIELSKLGTVCRTMISLLELNIADPVTRARPTLKHLKLTGSGKQRTRRPTAAEIEALLKWFRADRENTKLPMEDMIRVAMRSAFRRGELTRITWLDLDEREHVVIVRDRKDPRNKEGNDQPVPLIGEAFDVVMRQPRVEGDPRIFPFKPGTISKYFKRACDACKIKGLVFHDLRHEATSALFEQGWDIPSVASVTGHKNWNNLKRYTNLKAADIAKRGRVLSFPKLKAA